MDRIQKLVIQAGDDNVELLSWVSTRFTYLSVEEWRGQIISDRVLVNGSTTRPEILLNMGDIITYDPESITETGVNIDYKVVYEDNDLLVIDKPSNLPCHPGGIYFKNTLWYLLKQQYENFFMVNRLDRETSGIMLIARNKKSASFYHEKMKKKEIEKEYLVLVHGEFTINIDARGWLMNDNESIVRKKRKFISDKNAFGDKMNQYTDRESAHSFFKPLKVNDKYSLINCKIFTGRTHQIRATIYSGPHSQDMY